MADKELRKMNRTELIDIIYTLEKHNEELETEKKALEDKLNDEVNNRVQQLTEEKEALEAKLQEREIRMSESGSIAVAALELNKVFEAAQAAADDYLASVRATNAQAEKSAQAARITAEAEAARIVAEAKQQAAEMIAKAQADSSGVREECEAMRAKAEKETEERWAEFQRKCYIYIAKRKELSDFLMGNGGEA